MIEKDTSPILKIKGSASGVTTSDIGSTSVVLKVFRLVVSIPDPGTTVLGN